MVSYLKETEVLFKAPPLKIQRGSHFDLSLCFKTHFFPQKNSLINATETNYPKLVVGFKKFYHYAFSSLIPDAFFNNKLSFFVINDKTKKMIDQWKVSIPKKEVEEEKRTFTTTQKKALNFASILKGNQPKQDDDEIDDSGENEFQKQKKPKEFGQTIPKEEYPKKKSTKEEDQEVGSSDSKRKSRKLLASQKEFDQPEPLENLPKKKLKEEDLPNYSLIPDNVLEDNDENEVIDIEGEENDQNSTGIDLEKQKIALQIQRDQRRERKEQERKRAEEERKDQERKEQERRKAEEERMIEEKKREEKKREDEKKEQELLLVFLEIVFHFVFLYKFFEEN